MPVWWVMEPNITLWLNDEPLGYQPSRGARVSLQMNYQHDWLWAIPNSWYLENVPLHPNIFTFGTNWYSSWRSMLLAPTDSEPVIVYFGGGGQVTFYDREDDGTADGYINYNPDTRARILRQTNGSGVTVSFELQYANGAKDVYGEFRPAFEWPLFFLTAKVDPTGATTSFQYDPSTPSDIIRLKYVLDVDGRTNTIAYTNTVYTNHVTSVTDPYNRTVHFRYNENGILTNMIDVADIPSSFAYDMTGWLTNLVTPYGTTSFKIIKDS